MNGIITNPFAADSDYKSCSTLCFTSSVISEVSPKVYEDWIIVQPLTDNFYSIVIADLLRITDNIDSIQ